MFVFRCSNISKSNTFSIQIDSVNQSTFCYKHVLLDCLRTVQIFKSNKITAGCVIGINGFDDYEHVVTLLAALLVQCQIVLLDRNLNKGFYLVEKF